MPYIYKITNDINNKVYIGKTQYSIEKRWKEHIQDRKRYINRPLYRAMNKYGIEHFYIEELEKTDFPEKREVYWIEQYGSFKNGYNATLGGDGKAYINRDMVVSLYNQHLNCREVAELMNISVDSVRDILREKEITIKSSTEASKDKCSIKVAMIDLKTKEIIKVFNSYSDAGRYLQEKQISKDKNLKGIVAHIGAVCSHKRNSAYGFKWKNI